MVHVARVSDAHRQVSTASRVTKNLIYSARNILCSSQLAEILRLVLPVSEKHESQLSSRFLNVVVVVVVGVGGRGGGGGGGREAKKKRTQGSDTPGSG
jgi:hypothetical protein